MNFRINTTALTLLFSAVLYLNAQEFSSNWRGPARDGKYPETGLLKQWPEDGPKMVWSFDSLGEGHSTVAIDNEVIYTTGMIDSTGYIFAFEKNGTLKYKVEYGLEWNYNFNGTRSTPVIKEDKLYLLTGRGEIICLNKNNGKKIWSKHLIDDLNGKQIRFGVTENFLISGNKLFCTPGGEVNNVMALNINNGETIWSSKGLGNESCYGSPILINHNNKPILIQHVGQSILGFNPEDGTLLWSFLHGVDHAIHPNTPLYKDGSVFLHSGYGNSCKKVKLPTSESDSATLIWANDSLDNQMGGAILLDGYIYSSGHKKRGWKCISWETGTEQFSTTDLKGAGVSIFADGLIYCYTEKGMMALVDPNPGKFEIISSFKIEKGSNQHWAHPVISDGKLFVRHGNALMVFDIKESSLKNAGI